MFIETWRFSRSRQGSELIRHSVATIEIMSRPGMTEERAGHVMTSILLSRPYF